MCAKKYSENSTNLDFADLLGDVEKLAQDKVIPNYKNKVEQAVKQHFKELEQEPVVIRFSDAYYPFSSDEEAYHLEYRSHGVSLPLFKKMKKGRLPYSDNIDLHGFTREQARLFLSKQFQRWLDNGDQLVRITHGHGSGLIKKSLNAWLRQDDDVLAFCPTPTKGQQSASIFLLLKYYAEDGRELELLDID